jgi:hypothetical protein
MFAMKRVILTAAFIVAISGFAAAQSTSAKPTSHKQEKATIKKGPVTKTDSKNTVLKQEASANAKSDSTVKLILPMPNPSDTTAMPAVRKSDEF